MTSCTSLTPYHKFMQQLGSIYDPGEARAIALLVFETKFQLSALDICMGKDNDLLPTECNVLENIAQQLLDGAPIQYVLGEAQFMGHTFHVESGVLIPRPETEELVQWILSDRHEPQLQVLDIGTGSGCIAISLALALKNAQVWGYDISPAALHIARHNATTLQAKAQFKEVDILNHKESPTRLWDVIVSNPPYIRMLEKQDMAKHVTHHEPHLALFVDDNDPLVFYRAIAHYALDNLTTGGTLYVEINSYLGNETLQLFHDMGFSQAQLRTDQSDKDRMIKCIK